MRIYHLYDLGFEGLLSVICLIPQNIDCNHLDLDIFARHILRNVALVGIGLIDFVVGKIKIVGAVLGQLRSIRCLRGIHMELIVFPLPVHTVFLSDLRQTVCIIGICIRIERINGVAVSKLLSVFIGIIEVPEARFVVCLRSHAFVINIVRTGKHPDFPAVFIDLPPLIIEIKHLPVTDIIRHARLALDEIDLSNAVGGNRILGFHICCHKL